VQHKIDIRITSITVGIVIDPGPAADLQCEVVLAEPFLLLCGEDHPFAIHFSLANTLQDPLLGPVVQHKIDIRITSITVSNTLRNKVGGNRLTGGDLNGATQLLAYPTGIAPHSNRRYPDIDFVLHDRPQQWVLESIRQGEVDFGGIRWAEIV
jgi:DNA-binding transcriptional LysR family regulator